MGLRIGSRNNVFPIIDMETIIAKSTISDVREGCIKWLNKINAKITQNENGLIVADHKTRGRAHSWLGSDKVIKMDFLSVDEGTSLKIVMASVGNFGITEKRAFWGDMVLDLLEFINAELNADLMREIYSLSSLERRISAVKFSYGIVVSFCIVVSIILILKAGIIKTTFYFIILIVFCYILNILLRYDAIQNPFKLINELYPEYVTQTNDIVRKALLKLIE